MIKYGYFYKSGMGDFMSKQDLDLSAYRNSEVLAPSFPTDTKLQILKKYLAAKEEKYKNIADTSGAITIATGLISPIIAIGNGIGAALDPTVGFDSPAIIATSALAATGIASCIISRIIFKKACAKEDDFKYLKECAEAGIQSNKTLEKAKVYLKEENQTPSTLKTIRDSNCPKPPQYINPEHFTASHEDLGL